MKLRRFEEDTRAVVAPSAFLVALRASTIQVSRRHRQASCLLHKRSDQVLALVPASRVALADPSVVELLAAQKIPMPKLPLESTDRLLTLEMRCGSRLSRMTTNGASEEGESAALQSTSLEAAMPPHRKSRASDVDTRTPTFDNSRNTTTMEHLQARCIRQPGTLFPITRY